MLSREVAFYFWVTSSLIYFFLMSILIFVPLRSYLVDELTASQVIGSGLLCACLGPISFILLRLCNEARPLLPKQYLGLICLMPLLFVIVGAVILKWIMA